MNPATTRQVVVLDRDGTIVIDRGYLDHADGLEFLPRAAEGLQKMADQGHRLIVITNQSGVGRGLIPLARLHEMNVRLIQMVREVGAHIERIYFCPHRPEDHCACRKPQIQLMSEAASELGFEPAAAVVIGDKGSDMEFGRRAGAATILISSSPAGSGPVPIRADFIAADLVAAAQVLQQRVALGGRLSACT